MNASLIQSVVYIVYYIIIVILALTGLAGAYLLAAHGRSRVFSLAACLFFVIIFLAIFFASFATLHSLFQG